MGVWEYGSMGVWEYKSDILPAGRLQKMDRRFVVIAEELMGRVHDVQFIADKGELQQVQGRYHGIARRRCCNTRFNTFCSQ